MNQYDEALRATTTAENSAGSAYRENQEYLKSFEAQINMVKNAWTESVVAMRDSGLGDAMITGLKVGLESLNLLTAVIDKIGLLPTVLGGGSLAFLLLSERAKIAGNAINTALLSALTKFPVTANATRASALLLGATFETLAAKSKVAAVGVGILRGALNIAFPIAAIMAVGTAISFITEKVMNHVQAQREMDKAFEETMAKGMEAVSTNKEQVDSLLKSYEALSEKKNSSSLSTEEDEEYLRIQNELAQLFPTIVSHIDDKGNSHLKTSEEIQEEIKAMEKLLELERDKLILDAQNKYKEKIQDIQSYAKAIEEAEAKMLYAEAKRDSGSKKAKAEGEREFVEAEIEKLKNEMMLSAANADLSGIVADVIEANFSKLPQRVAPAIGNAMSSVVDLINFNGADINASELEGIVNVIAGIAPKLDQAFRSDNVGEYSKVIQELQTYLKSVGIEADLTSLSFNEIKQVTENLIKAAEEGGKAVNEYGEDMEDTGDSALAAAEKIDEKATALERLTGVTEKSLQATDELLFVYNDLASQAVLTAEQTALLGETQASLLSMFPEIAQESLDLINVYDALSQKQFLTAEETRALQDATESLLALHPELMDSGISRANMMDLVMDKIAEEVRMNDIYLASVKAKRDGALTMEQEQTLQHLKEVNARIENMKVEMENLARVNQKYREMYDTTKLAYDNIVAEFGAGSDEAGRAALSMMRYSQMATRGMGDVQLRMATATAERVSLTNDLSKSNEVMTRTTTDGNRAARENAKAQDKAAKSTKGATKAQKDHNEKIKEAIYLTDTYRVAQEKLNVEMAKLNETKAKNAQYTKEHLNALQQELDLLYAKKDLKRQEARDANEQLRTGNIKQTGIVKYNASSPAPGNSPQAIVWNYFKSKGLSDNAVAGIMGNIQQESGFNPKNVNKSSGASGLFQWLGSRKTGLMNYAKSVGKSWTDLSVQLDYAWKELTTSEKRALEVLKKNNLTASQHASEFDRLFERSGRSQVAKRQQYANQALTNFRGTTSNPSQSSGVSQSMGDYYLNNSAFRKNQSIQWRTSNGGYLHTGVDLIAKQGTDIKAVKPGKVVGVAYHNTAGHYIDVRHDDGLVSRYLHMQKKSHLKKGDLVQAGQVIGKVGNTGRSTTPHLHFEIRDPSKKAAKGDLSPSYGLALDPVAWLKNQTQGVSSSSEIVAEYEKSVDQLRSDLRGMELDLLTINEEIRKKMTEIVDALLSVHEHRRFQMQQIIDYETAKLKEVDIESDRYGKTLDKITKHLKAQQKANKEELELAEELIKSKKLNQIETQRLKDRVWELKVAMTEMNAQIQAMDMERFNVLMRTHERIIENINYEYERSKIIMSLYEEGTSDYNEQLEKQIELLKQTRDERRKQREEAQKKLLDLNLSLEDTEEAKKQIQELSLEYWNLTSSIEQAEKALESSRKKLAEDTADKLIAAYKEYLNEKRDMHLKSIDDELEAENKRHKKVMDNYREELDAFRKIIQEKIDALNKEEEERVYAKEIDKLEEERLKILNQLNLLSLDDSLEAKAERKRLNEDLAKIEEDIFEKRHAKELADRKENLTEMLEEKEKQITEEEKAAEEQHEKNIERIDKERKYWEQFYIDQLNDERKFAKMKEDIVAGNFDALSREFQEYIKEMEDTMPDLLNTLDGTMEAVGDSIRKNIIEQLKEALNLLSQVEEDKNRSSAPGGDGWGAGQPSDKDKKTSLSAADLMVLTAKVLNDQIAPQEESLTRRAKIKDKAYALAAQGRAAGSTIKSDQGLQDIIKGLNYGDLELLGKHLQNEGFESLMTPYLQEMIKTYGRQLYGNAGSNNEATGTAPVEKNTTLNHGDLLVLTGKFYTEQLAAQEESEVRKGKIREKAYALSAEGREKGSTMPANKGLQEILKDLTKGDLEMLGNFLIGDGAEFVITPYLQDIVRKYGRQLLSSAAQLSTGGYTGEWGSSGKIGILHEKEIILNKNETKRFFDLVPVLENLNHLIKPLNLPPITRPDLSNNSGDISYRFEFYVDKMTGSEKDADNFMKQINDRLKRNKGMR